MGKTFVILVHGFRVGDGGADTIKKLEPYFEEWPEVTCYPFTYGYTHLLTTRYYNEEIAEDLKKVIVAALNTHDRVIVVGHSNGCTIAHLASYKLPVEAEVEYVYINPALKKHLTPSERVTRVDVYHNRKDYAVVWSKLLFWQAEERPWGAMGNTGYEGNDERMKNYNTEHFLVPALGHSAVFKDKKIKYYGIAIPRNTLMPREESTYF